MRVSALRTRLASCGAPAVLGLCRMTQTSGFEAAQSIAPGGVRNQLIVGDAEPMFRNDAGGGPIGRPYKRTLASDSSFSAKAGHPGHAGRVLFEEPVVTGSS